MSHNNLMYHLRNAPVYALWLVCGIAFAAIVFAFFLWVLLLVGGILGIALAVWAVGTRFEIKQSDVVVGHLKWFTYTPVKEKVT